jgi:hypothetical protein
VRNAQDLVVGAALTPLQRLTYPSFRWRPLEIASDLELLLPSSLLHLNMQACL